MLVQITPELAQSHQWGRAMVQTYMSWYVFFLAGNIAMLGWMHARRALRAAKKAMSAFRGIAGILAFQNAGGIVSTVVIIWYLSQLVRGDAPLRVFVLVAGVANTLALVVLLTIWLWVFWKRTYEIPFATAKD